MLRIDKVYVIRHKVLVERLSGRSGEEGQFDFFDVDVEEDGSKK